MENIDENEYDNPDNSKSSAIARSAIFVDAAWVAPVKENAVKHNLASGRIRGGVVRKVKVQAGDRLRWPHDLLLQSCRTSLDSAPICLMVAGNLPWAIHIRAFGPQDWGPGS